MAAEAQVVVGGVDNLLVVPTAAVQRAGATRVAQVLKPDGTTGQVQVQVQVGMVGDSTTQVVDVLTEGQQVVVTAH
jgi:HlyD family secretion protein